MFPISTPSGEQIQIPASIDEDNPYFAPDQPNEAADYYNREGYVVIRGCAPAEACDAAREAFEKKIKRYPDYLYRQTGGNPEKNRFNDRSFVMNPILNVQDVPTASLGDFRVKALHTICNANTRNFLRYVFEEEPKLVQSMYFEGNSQTWPHQDTYYLDSEKIGTMVAAWYAVEDIQPGAGRFFVYPRSHLIDLGKNGGDFDVAFNHARYKKLIVDIIRDHKLECRAPALKKGDVLFWNARTIHGSLETRQPEFSRSSLTAHFIPLSHRFLQFQSRIKKLNNVEFEGWAVHQPKSLDRLGSRAVLFFETRFPKSFQRAKWLAVKMLVTH